MSLRRERDLKREIKRLQRQRDEFRQLPGKLEAAERETKMWRESSEKYAIENGQLRQEISHLRGRLNNIGALGFEP